MRLDFRFGVLSGIPEVRRAKARFPGVVFHGLKAVASTVASLCEAMMGCGRVGVVEGSHVSKSGDMATGAPIPPCPPNAADKGGAPAPHPDPHPHPHPHPYPQPGAGVLARIDGAIG